MSNTTIHTVPRWKIILNVQRFLNNPIPLLNETIAKYGDTYITYIGGKTKTVITIDPKLIQHVLQKNHSKYQKSKMQTDLLAKYIGKGLLTTNGSYWLRQRRLIQPGFHKKKLASLVHIMNTEIVTFCDELSQRIKMSPELDISQEMMKLTLRVVSRSLFSTGIKNEDIEKLGKIIVRLQRAIVNDIRQPYFAWWRKLSGYDKESIQLAKESYQLISQIIDARKASSAPSGDLLDMLLAVRYADTNEPMTDQQVLEEALVLFVAGHETSANAMSWMIYLLSQNKKYKQEIVSEIDESKADNHSLEDVMSWAKISNGISETIRLYPPAWITDRVVLEEDEFEGLQLNVGDIVSPYIYGVHNSAKIWRDHNVFDPERFMGEKRKQIPAFAYFPFGGGPRLCIGQQFALTEMQLIIFHLYQRFEFELLPDQKIDVEPLVTLRPKHGIKMNIVHRGK